MERWRDVTVGDLIDGIKRYQPFLITVVVLVLIAVVLPGRNDEDNVAASGRVEDSVVDTETTDTTPGDTTAATSGGGGGGRRTGTGAAVDRTQTGSGAFGGEAPAAGKVESGANCDPKTGRIAVPSVYAPPCAPKFDGDNGGGTYRGVTGDTVKIAVYIGELDPATGAILRAAGAEDEPDDVWATYNDYADYFQHHYETYGRTFELIRIDGGQPDDDVAAKANAEEVKEKGAFISLNGPTDTNVYMRELAAAGIICICTVSQPVETYLDNAPYVWSNLMSSTQLYTHRAEYIGKRLWGRKAVHAGDSTYALRNRTFALVYFDTAEGTYKAGADFFVQELKKYGASLADRIAVTGAHVDTAGAQQEAPVVSQRLKDKDITSVVFAGDPLYPIFLTQEATRDTYFPEWIVTGSVLSDTTAFGRLYDQNQWSHAFGLSALAARTAEELVEAWRVHLWHHDGKTPVADGQYSAIIYPPWWIAATGIHMAGEKLTPETFRDGLFAYPRTGDGPVHPSTSFGRGIWQWDDYLRLDDTAEIWWDPTVSGESEIGTPGVGVYRYVNRGQRYRAGQWPTTEPQVFCCNENTTVIHEDAESIPDRWPEYEHTPHS